MNDPAVNMFLAGMVTAGLLTGGLFFARFWARSRDSLFLAFTAAFWLAGAEPGIGRISGATRSQSNLVLSAACLGFRADRRRHRAQERCGRTRRLGRTAVRVNLGMKHKAHRDLQFAVLPWRIGEGGLREVILLTTRETHHCDRLYQSSSACVGNSMRRHGSQGVELQLAGSPAKRRSRPFPAVRA